MSWVNGAVNFCGAQGASYKFERFGAEQDWAKVPGVVLFAAPEGKSWRIIRVADQGGVEGDVATFWRWREARRYGATAIFIRRNADIKARRLEAADSEVHPRLWCAVPQTHPAGRQGLRL